MAEEREKSSYHDAKSFYEKEGLMANRYESTQFWERRYHQIKAKLVFGIMDRVVEKSLLVLDAGSGSGEFSRHARNLGGHVVSLDISKSYLRRTRDNTDYLVCASLDALPFASQFFDIVLCADVIEHVKEFNEVLDELHRVSRDILVITTPCEGILRKLFGRLLPSRLAQIDMNVGHLCIFPLSELRRKFTHFDFATDSRSYHVTQPIIDGVIPKQLVKFVNFSECLANMLLPDLGTISFVVSKRKGPKVCR